MNFDRSPLWISKRVSLLGLMLILGTCLILILPVEAIAEGEGPDTGKMSWELFQKTKAGQRTKAAGEEVPTISALLTTQEPPTDKQLEELSENGYTVFARYGRLVIVKAPADYYIDEERGIQNIAFIQNATLPPEPLTGGEDLSRPITSGTAATGATDLWDSGHQGKGVDIAVIDLSFDPKDDRLKEMNSHYYLVKPDEDDPLAYTVEKEAVSGSE
ncbi:hypothetical protein KGY64_07175, partial [Candidatus Bipolaricaulota bacterium]|nr:hypothetical protein [Candidatus Bipolaricaulota bacterium]